jgi:hypothetical protein
MKTKQEQTAEFKAILDKYDQKTQILYNEILRVCGTEAAHMSKAAMRGKLLGMIEDAIREASV